MIIGDDTGSCCLPFEPVGDLEQTGVGSRAGRCHCLLHVMCFGPEMVAFDSNGGGPVLLIADIGLVMFFKLISVLR